MEQNFKLGDYVYFIDNYDEEIKDGDLICTDLIYYSKDLKKNKS